jgi:hypothetical protein
MEKRLPRVASFVSVIAVQHSYRINIGRCLYSNVSSNALRYEITIKYYFDPLL